MSSPPLCFSCRSRACNPPSPLCTICQALRHSSPSSAIDLRICSLCDKSEASSVCLCTFPLFDLCVNCTPKHTQYPSSNPHIVQCKALHKAIQTKSDYDRYRIRGDRISQAQGKLKVWCISAIEKARYELASVVRKIHTAVDEQWKECEQGMKRCEEKVRGLGECLEQMKCDYSLRSGTFLDAISSPNGVFDESQLDPICSLTSFQTNTDSLHALLSYFFSFSDLVPEAAVDRSNVDFPNEFSPATEFTSHSLSHFHTASHSTDYSRPVSADLSQSQPGLPPSYSFDGDTSKCSLPAIQECATDGGSNQQPMYPVCSQCRKYVPYQHYFAYNQPIDPAIYCICWQAQAQAAVAPSIEPQTQGGTAEKCAICESHIRDKSWIGRIPQKLMACAAAINSVCSLNCFEKFCELAGMKAVDKVCMKCRQPCKEELRTVKLDCGHSFHDLNCFYGHLREVSGNFSHCQAYKCPSCSQQIDFPTINQHFGPTSLQNLSVIRHPIACHVCKNSVAIYPLPCSHSCCAYCASRGNAACRTCGKSSSCSPF